MEPVSIMPMIDMKGAWRVADFSSGNIEVMNVHLFS